MIAPTRIIGGFANGEAEHLLAWSNLETFDMIIEAFDTIRSLSFLAGIPASDIPNALGARYEPVNWAAVSRADLGATVVALKGIRARVLQAIDLARPMFTEDVQSLARLTLYDQLAEVCLR